MSDFKLPDLPSDDELGITDEDREKYGDDVPDDGPEMSADEMAALLGGTPRSSSPTQEPSSGRPPKKKKSKGRRGEKSVDEPSEPASSGGEGGAAAGRPRALEPQGPRSRWRGALTLAALLAMALMASSRTGQPRPVPANAPDTAFSSARAMSVLVDIARRPRPIGSPEHARVRELLLDRLDELGFETEVQTTTALAELGGAARAATVRNIVGRLAGTSPTGAILLVAHYDSRELAPGAGDDGAGIVAILEAARALRAGPPIRNDVIVLFTDAEEPCLCGAQAFVAEHRWMDDVSVVLNFEMRGGGGSSLMFETKDQNGWIVRALQNADPPPYANSLAYEVYRRMPNNTDFTVFKEAGVQGLNFAALDRARVYHQSTDRVENLSESTLQHHGVGALSMLRHLGDVDLAEVDAPDSAYLTVPILGIVVYDGFWAVPISGILLAAALLAWLLARRQGVRVAGVVTGFGVALLGAGLAFGVGLWLRTCIAGFFPEAGSLAGSVLHSEGWWVVSGTAAAFTVVTTLYGVSRRWLGALELALGGLLVPLGLAIAASLYVPLGAPNLQWPVAAALLSVLLMALLGPRSVGALGGMIVVLLAAPVLAILVPLVELVWLAMTAQLIAVLLVVVVVTLHMCLPALESLRHPNAWWAPATGLVVAAGAFGMATLTASPSPNRPAPSTLAYAYEHGTGSALWLTDPGADDELDARAIEWAAERAGAPFTRTRDMTDFGYPAGPTPVSEARLVNAPPPSVVVESDSIEGPVRHVTLSVSSNIGAEALRFQLDPDGDTRILSLNGAAIAEPNALEWVEHYGVPADNGVRLELRMPASEPIGLYVLEQHFRPRELLGPAPFERPEDLAPDVNAGSDRAVFRYSVAAFADPRHAFMPGGVRDPSAGPVEATPAVPEATPPAASDSAAPTVPEPTPDSLR